MTILGILDASEKRFKVEVKMRTGWRLWEASADLPTTLRCPGQHIRATNLETGEVWEHNLHGA